ncbi:LysR family transcriptional regulator [Segetibacter sp. 3557_3]|uniref:LysR substrate-binding domain-containing protein n=1 Tax=Segetibacter sp. 3557_3 TaxID=2547429 RepID=UPI001058834E|nr:LysR substrate-binding domain-containing protein [Segetibacter sp. 3557_3]TDH27420.1 LysR family transcriptional regulator [Segetibacter sp. 3557_3]
MLSTKHLIFLEVARQKSFTKASQVLFLSQPAISKNIQSLENDYKSKLFERQGLKIALTPTGKLLYERLLDVKNIQDQVDFEISFLKDKLLAKGMLRLGASTTVALYILPRILSAFHKQYPEVEINLLNRNSESVLEALLQKNINLGIVEGPGNTKNVEYLPFLTDKVVPVCNSRSSLAHKKISSIKELPAIPVVLREKGSGTLAALSQSLEAHKIKISDLNVKVRLGGTEALKNFLLEADCLGFLPQRAIIKELAANELSEVQIQNLEITRHFYFIQRKGESINELNKAFIAFARTIYNQQL